MIQVIHTFKIYSFVCFVTQVQDRLCTAPRAQILISNNTPTCATSTPIVNQGPHTHPFMMILSSPGFGNGPLTSHRQIGRNSAIILHYLLYIPKCSVHEAQKIHRYKGKLHAPPSKVKLGRMLQQQQLKIKHYYSKQSIAACGPGQAQYLGPLSSVSPSPLRKRCIRLLVA